MSSLSNAQETVDRGQDIATFHSYIHNDTHQNQMILVEVSYNSLITEVNKSDLFDKYSNYYVNAVNSYTSGSSDDTVVTPLN